MHREGSWKPLPTRKATTLEINMIDCKQMMELKGEPINMLIAKNEEQTKEAKLIIDDIDPKL